MNYQRLKLSGIFVAGLLVGTLVIAIVDAVYCNRDTSSKEAESAFSIDNCIGLVLAGGGAKGAYEVGVWKAMEELGLTERVYAFSGTSIGAINSALFASVSSASKCEEIWSKYVDDTFSVDPELGKAICKTDGLRRLIRETLPTNWTKKAPFVYATATTKEERKIKRFCLNGLNVSTYGEFLMASSAIPYLFPAVKIGDIQYVDGGVSLGDDSSIDNVPLQPLLDAHPELKTIIIVYLDGATELRERQSQLVDTSAKLIEIIPSVEMNDGLLAPLDFSQKNISNLIRIGYEDAKKVLQAEFPMSVN